MDREGVAGWLAAYVEAWKSYDRAAIVALFGERASYRYHPYDEPIVGNEAIADSWLAEGDYRDDEWGRDEPGTYDATYQPFAVEGTQAVVTGTSTYTNPDGSIRTIYDNCFLIRFDDDGRCSEFVEFFMERPAN